MYIIYPKYFGIKKHFQQTHNHYFFIFLLFFSSFSGYIYHPVLRRASRQHQLSGLSRKLPASWLHALLRHHQQRCQDKRPHSRFRRQHQYVPRVRRGFRHVRFLERPANNQPRRRCWFRRDSNRVVRKHHGDWIPLGFLQPRSRVPGRANLHYWK